MPLDTEWIVEYIKHVIDNRNVKKNVRIFENEHVILKMVFEVVSYDDKIVKLVINKFDRTDDNPKSKSKNGIEIVFNENVDISANKLNDNIIKKYNKAIDKFGDILFYSTIDFYRDGTRRDIFINYDNRLSFIIDNEDVKLYTILSEN